MKFTEHIMERFITEFPCSFMKIPVIHQTLMFVLVLKHVLSQDLCSLILICKSVQKNGIHMFLIHLHLLHQNTILKNHLIF